MGIVSGSRAHARSTERVPAPQARRHPAVCVMTCWMVALVVMGGLLGAVGPAWLERVPLQCPY